MARKASDAECRANYDRLKELFNHAVPDGGRFEVVAAYGVDVGMMNFVVVRTHTYTYTNYAVGFDAQANEIVIVPVSVEMDGYGQPIYLRHDDVRKARQNWLSKEITIRDGQFPKGYVQFAVSPHINDDPDNVCIKVKQNDEAKAFTGFFKTRFKK